MTGPNLGVILYFPRARHLNLILQMVFHPLIEASNSPGCLLNKSLCYNVPVAGVIYHYQKLPEDCPRQQARLEMTFLTLFYISIHNIL